MFPDNPLPWICYGEMECLLEEFDRARNLYESAINLPALNMPETIWKSYIDMEISLGEEERARELYKRLLEKTKHLKVWISIAEFEQKLGNLDNLRSILNKGDEYYRTKEDHKEERKI